MKKLNEDINRLRQIMSYDRSRSLLISESQYSIEDSIEIEEQETETQDNSESIAKQIYRASKGLGTDESSFVDAVKDIKSKEEFDKVDELLKSYDYGDDTQGFDYYVMDEMGMNDVDSVESIVRHLKTIGVNASYETYPNGNQIKSFTIDGEKTDSEEVSGSENTEETKDISIEDIKSGSVLLKKDGQNENSETVKQIQQKLIEKLKEGGINIQIDDADLGNYGPKTAALVVAYQSLNGLKPDGIVGKNTITSLGF
jgi:hypothetical protein